MPLYVCRISGALLRGPWELKMKTSEFIRRAVDESLAANEKEKWDGKCRGLCASLRFTMLKLQPTKYPGNTREYKRAHELIVLELDRQIPLNRSWFMFPAHYSYEDKQACRFMFAEFMALYFEDQND